MKQLAAITVLLIIAFGGNAAASTPTAEFATCLTDSLDGKERKALARWIFFGMGAHPEISKYLNADEETIDSTDRMVAGLLMRLLTEDCPQQFKAASASDPQAITKAFETVGQVAMVELTANEAVMAALSAYGQYVDDAALHQASTP